VNRGERLIKFRDSWFSAKPIEVGCIDKSYIELENTSKNSTILKVFD
jgi:hypothetical protein